MGPAGGRGGAEVPTREAAAPSLSIQGLPGVFAAGTGDPAQEGRDWGAVWVGLPLSPEEPCWMVWGLALKACREGLGPSPHIRPPVNQ